MKSDAWLNRLPVTITAVVCAGLYIAGGLHFEKFFGLRVITNLLGDNSFIGILAIGETFVILTGGIDLSVGAMLGGEIARRYGSAGLPDETIRLRFSGSAGQSLGAFLPRGVTITLEGEANDYVGKGLSGGRIVIFPPNNSGFLPEESILVGNVVLYGATAGEVFLNGVAGERFAVRNSGASAVVEGLGDHGCEYMTNGLVVVLGACGRNFAAGMSGGLAYVLNEDGEFARTHCNPASVDLEPLHEQSDIDKLRAMIERHLALTGSPRAAWILDNWTQTLPKFLKVYPHELKKVFTANRDREAEVAGNEISREAFGEKLLNVLAASVSTSEQLAPEQVHHG